jgi:hypothetical protein
MLLAGAQSLFPRRTTAVERPSESNGRDKNMAKKTHFKGVGKEKIHTSREGKCNEFGEKEGGSCNYAGNADKAAPPACKASTPPRQAHHVLCVSSTIGYKSDKAYKGSVRTIDGVYKNTVWCVNQKENMIWLPLKGTYLAKGNNKDSKRDAPGEIWKMNLPCHDWDHNCKGGYTAEVTAEFKAQIWKEIDRRKNQTPCFDHTEALTLLKDMQDDFRGKLKTRGNRDVAKGKGTEAALLSEGTPLWWLPFSMADDGIAGDRPVAGMAFATEVPKSLRRVSPS